MGITVVSSGQIFEELLGDINYSDDERAMKLYPFKVRVGVIKRRPPRHTYFDFIRDLGMGDIDKVFQKKSFGKLYLTFVFPERWMGVAEQQGFMTDLEKHPESKKLKKVDILTSSPLIVSSFFNTQIRVITFEDDDEYACYCNKF